MSAEDSPYVDEPTEGVDRRTFVKYAMGAAALGTAGAAGFGLFKQAAIVKPSTIKSITYLGAKVGTGSPAPRGLPIIPVRVNDEGVVEGIPETEGENHLDWLRYCSHEQAPGLADPEFTNDNSFEYFLTEEKLAVLGPEEAAERYWYHDKLGETVKASDFDGRPAGTGAAVRWRSQGQAGNDVITAIILKMDPADMNLSEEQLERFMDLETGLAAFSSFCTHFCCVPGWKEDPSADKLGFWDWIFCTCHNSRYDPRELTEYRFDLKLADAAEDASAGASGGGGGH